MSMIKRPIVFSDYITESGQYQGHFLLVRHKVSFDKGLRSVYTYSVSICENLWFQAGDGWPADLGNISWLMYWRYSAAEGKKVRLLRRYSPKHIAHCQKIIHLIRKTEQTDNLWEL